MTSGRPRAGARVHDGAVGAVQRDLEAAAEREAVDEAERRLAAVTSWPSLRKTAWPSSRDDAYGVGPTALDDVRSAPAARMNGLPVTPRASIVSSARAASMAVLSASSDAEPERVGLGVVLAVVEGDQAEGPAARQGDLAQLGLGHALGVRGELLGTLEQSSRWLTWSSPVPVRVLPDHGAAHADADAHGGQAVADLGTLLERRASWVIRRTPEEASGWPMAIAPPYGFTRGSSSAMPKCSRNASTWTANASLTSKASMSSMVRPALAERLLGRRDRAGAHHLGLDTGRRRRTRGASGPAGRARGRSPRRRGGPRSRRR